MSFHIVYQPLEAVFMGRGGSSVAHEQVDMLMMALNRACGVTKRGVTKSLANVSAAHVLAVQNTHNLSCGRLGSCPGILI